MMTGGIAGKRRGVMAFCLALTLLNYLDRVVISFAISPIQKEFGLDNAQFGLLMSAFALGTLAVNGIAGVLLDRGSVRALWGGAVLLWSLVMIGQGLVAGLAVFLLLRFLLGVGEGVNFPAMNRVMADWMSPGQLGKSLAIGLVGVPLALLIGGPLSSQMIAGIGWRGTFAALGVAGLVLGGLMLWLYRDGPNRRSAARHPGGAGSWRDLLRDRTMLATCWSFFAFGYVLFFGVSWLPGYLEQTYGMDLKATGWFSVLPWGMALGLMVLAGWLSDRLMARTGSVRAARVHLIWIGQAVAVVFFGALLVVRDPLVAVVCLSLAIGFAMMPNASFYSICTDLFPDRSGAATGILVTFFSASGIVSPLLTGWLSHAFGGFQAAIGALILIVGSAVFGMVVFARPDAKVRA